MRIAVISTTSTPIPPKHYGGEIYFWLIAKYFGEKGYDTTLYAPASSTPPPNVKLRYIPHTYGKASHQAEARVWKLWSKEILEHDIILECSHNHLVGEQIYYFHPEHKDKVLNVLNGMVSIYPRSPFNLSVGSESWKECLIKGESQFKGTRWEKLYGDSILPVEPEAIRAVIPWAIDVESFSYVKDKEDYWLFLSRPTPYKGLLNLIKLARLMDEKFVVACPLANEDHKYWFKKYKLSLDRTPNIKVIRSPSNEEKKELMANARGFLFLHESKEPFGLIPLEAMATGTPVVATALGALIETVKEGGILCRFDPKRRMVDLVDACRKMERIDEVKPRDARKNAERYDYERIAPKYLEVL